MGVWGFSFLIAVALCEHLHEIPYNPFVSIKIVVATVLCEQSLRGYSHAVNGLHGCEWEWSYEIRCSSQMLSYCVNDPLGANQQFIKTERNNAFKIGYLRPCSFVYSLRQTAVEDRGFSRRTLTYYYLQNEAMFFTHVCHSVHGMGSPLWCHFVSGCLVPCSIQGFLSLIPCYFWGDLCPGGSLSERFLSRGLCPGGLCLRGLCPRVSVQRACLQGSLSRGVSIRESSQTQIPIGWRASGMHPTGILSCFSKKLPKNCIEQGWGACPYSPWIHHWTVSSSRVPSAYHQWILIMAVFITVDTASTHCVGEGTTSIAMITDRRHPLTMATTLQTPSATTATTTPTLPRMTKSCGLKGMLGTYSNSLWASPEGHRPQHLTWYCDRLRTIMKSLIIITCRLFAGGGGRECSCGSRISRREAPTPKMGGTNRWLWPFCHYCTTARNWKKKFPVAFCYIPTIQVKLRI